MKEAKFKCRIEELPFLGYIILSYFRRDKNDFMGFSPEYQDPFESEIEGQIKTVEELVAPQTLIGQQKLITGRINDHFTHGRNLLNKLERFIDKASKNGVRLTISPSDFGIKAVRAEINSKNDEGVVLNLKSVQKNMEANVQSLEGKGYTGEVQTELNSLIRDLTTDSVAQTEKKKEREQLVSDNIEQLNKLWFMIDDLLKTGKTIYKEKDKNKIKDYTYIDLLKNVQVKHRKVDPEAIKAS